MKTDYKAIFHQGGCANNERQLDPTPDRLKEKGFIKTKLKERAKTNMADDNTNNTGRPR